VLQAIASTIGSYPNENSSNPGLLVGTMLREIEDPKQHPGEPFRRCFLDSSVDLFVWFSDDHFFILKRLSVDQWWIPENSKGDFKHFGMPDPSPRSS
jgi:hypothetical protein